MRAMNRRTDSSSWKIFSTSIESSGRRIQIEMESLCTSMPRWTNERCERLDTGRLLSAWGSFCLRVDDPRLNWQRSRPFHDDYRHNLSARTHGIVSLVSPAQALHQVPEGCDVGLVRAQVADGGVQGRPAPDPRRAEQRLA